MVLHVDDILLAHSDTEVLHKTAYFLLKSFEMLALAEASFELEIEIVRERSSAKMLEILYRSSS